MPMFKLRITITDDTGSINATAFSYIAEDLVERNAYQASQNMKIDAADHTVSLQTAIGKIRLFHIAMSNDLSSNFSIKYVLRKSYPIDDPPSTLLLLNKEDTPASQILSLPAPDNTRPSSSSTKRCLQFENEQKCHKQSKPKDSVSNESIQCSEKHESTSDDQHKRQEKMPADQDTDNLSADQKNELPSTPKA
ncbi:hypothetical protein BS78_10G241300 [Paspalum vaginatum]|nr:hypothetical protein BS78_10G241300 [Paspalum vaginatum]